MSAERGMAAARNGGFQDRVRFFAVKAAVAVMSEAAVTASHAERVAYAKKILAGELDLLDLSIAVVTNAAVLAAGFDAPDGDLEFTVNSLFNAFAGVAA